MSDTGNGKTNEAHVRWARSRLLILVLDLIVFGLAGATMSIACTLGNNMYMYCTSSWIPSTLNHWNPGPLSCTRIIHHQREFQSLYVDSWFEKIYSHNSRYLCLWYYIPIAFLFCLTISLSLRVCMGRDICVSLIWAKFTITLVTKIWVWKRAGTSQDGDLFVQRRGPACCYTLDKTG